MPRRFTLKDLHGMGLAVGRDGVAVPITKAETPKKRRGVMNKWEQRYADRLEILKREGEVSWYGFEVVKVRLAEGAWYTPDFVVAFADGRMEWHEVKGHWREAARLRVKVAAEAIPCMRVACCYLKARGWELEYIRARQV